MTHFLTFLRRSLYTHRHDISQPYHKIIDLLIKLVSLYFAIVGGLLLVTVPYCYGTGTVLNDGALCTQLYLDSARAHAFFLEGRIDEYFLMKWVTGLGYMVITLFLSQVLVVRHLNETLPDHIYLRCFASEEEKSKRLPMKEKTY